MTGWMEIANISISIAGFMMALLEFILALTFHTMNKWYRRFFLLFFGIMMLYVTSDLLSFLSLLYFGPDYAGFTKVLIFLESFFSALLMPLFTLLLLHSCKEDPKKSRLLRISMLLLTLYLILLIITQFTSKIYYVTNNNEYFRGPFYPLLLIPPVLLLVCNLIAMVRRRSTTSRFYERAFYSYLIIPLAAMILQVIFYGLSLIVLATTVAALIMYTQILQYQVRKTVRWAEETARQKTDIMLLQMRPHFIYNVMTSIYYLCAMDAKKAQQVTGDFMVYLRKNFSAISKQESIPFDEELEHTRAYLSVEKARYEKLLSVDYEIAFTQFRLPPLTLQPIVENAVKHGVDPEMKPLHITIRTYHTGQKTILSVEDTGPGFSPADDDEVHIGLTNVKERLRLMSDATLEITARKGGGTVVTITIPQKQPD